MKLLLDQNLSHRLVAALDDVFPGSLHVRDVGLARAGDEAIWEHARSGGFVIASKDNDFQHLAFVSGFPPKVLWLRVGNCPTGEIEALLRRHAADIRGFVEDQSSAVLILG